MRYLGGKYRLRKKIAKVLNNLRETGQFYWEPFVGSAWVTTKIEMPPVFCSDINHYLIAMWNAIMQGWVPPGEISEKLYKRISNNKQDYPKELVSFVGFGCSWGGKWFGGYARGEERNWAREARDSLMRKKQALEKLQPNFFTLDFLNYERKLDYAATLIYCDPPYKNTTGYAAVDSWDTDKFWNKVRELSADGHKLVVSEYAAPDDFKCIAEFPTKTDLNTERGKESRIERLFTI